MIYRICIVPKLLLVRRTSTRGFLTRPEPFFHPSDERTSWFVMHWTKRAFWSWLASIFWTLRIHFSTSPISVPSEIKIPRSSKTYKTFNIVSTSAWLKILSPARGLTQPLMTKFQPCRDNIEGPSHSVVIFLVLLSYKMLLLEEWEHKVYFYCNDCKIFYSICSLSNYGRSMFVMFNLKPVHYNLRDKNRAVQPKVNSTAFGLKSLKYSGSLLWNQLPTDLKRCLDITSFKSLLKSWEGPNCKCGVCLLCNAL